MSSPNEPGRPRVGESGGGNGSSGSGHDGGSLGNSVTRSGPAPAHSAEHGDVPPWQRGPASRRQPQQSAEGQPPSDSPRANPPGLDARLNRFIAGAPAPSAAPEAEAPSRGERTDVVRPEGLRPDQSARPDQSPRPDGGSGAYASELPDLSGPPPRPQQQRKPVERPVTEQPAKTPGQTSGAGRAVQVATRQQHHKGPVRASMQIRRIDPWSALKVSLVLSVAMFFVWMIAVAFLYLVLGGMGVWSKLNSNVGDLLTSASGTAGGELVSSGTIFGGAALIGLVNIVLLTAAATIGTFIYNLTTDLVGGVEVTLADRD
ncbi:DUF3566 domain-containing protein [Mycolicibacterium hippocampi]|uniref:DUF3566 domain-containing protein n=1 Tax=Mycolicibacterium hippocampi TaxID=659824 RepID=A0A850PP28_9MYCO|nr:hypothetical protein [Mycolicibacterium hippocampi]